ncbi:MAG: replication-associated recombination protein A [Firmicutes bacterium]|nr:replication-associated recombination protein A [Bacillota bacterium]
MNTPLAERMRPQTFDEVCGQKHILGENAPLKRLLEAGKLSNMIFYGPSGTGKTTVAGIIAKNAGMEFRRLNATTATSADVRAVIDESDSLIGADGILLYIDELQYFNRKQQQTLLEYIEDGRITLIASTTENPYFCIYKAIISRSAVFEFKQLEKGDILPALDRGLARLNDETGGHKTASAETLSEIAFMSGGDVRSALNSLELAYYVSRDEITVSDARSVSPKGYLAYDRSADDHYELVSALQKSIRGSDENAAIFYLAKLLESGDLLSPCRRLLVIASEDIGLAFPMAAAITKACVDSALQLGLPEAKIPLSEAVVMLATAPKSNTAYMAYNAAAADINKGLGKQKDMPSYLKNNHFFGEGEQKGDYLYPHDFPNSWVEQQYLPNDLKDRIYYRFGQNKTEQAALDYRNKIRKDRKQ